MVSERSPAGSALHCLVEGIKFWLTITGRDVRMIKVTQWSKVRLRSSSCANDSYYWSWLFIMEISRRGIIYYGNPVIEVPGLITPNSAANDQLSMVYYRYLRSRKVGTLHVAKASAGCEVVNSTHLPLKRSLVLCLHGS
ncbi:uncharacterized protein [Spinacia oleracea]|uniref:Uncharacterized protein isoform X2 n=1 Tax=Spinacia oleracea TaxID=3562 RepID=A0ABM3RVR5_SPIOL|nr:uncharacterized protein LOC110792641 isoform X2 [Spinacia oleracea]XP_056699719.1 uncharacterized protein LOC110792641 isoform X2 [Spinacia oleracea]XP_056699720.1 uncharacterized protein LOC110792641 isoform X2 [Spinacia oleracea]XP_056699721.1 uncharacterized protein LOC110792641 isoform X2 [Spinacia oleracea]XP_056699722.1 uncharacterized protein LOC110792641 isoform X2 [Spinacia oleracea]XP_056699723.1 uncharacterized protein LOC110792641 isoform X2 [Spinacia oleracea]